ncbi:anthranilate synthase component I [Allobranchiibius sp. GilTou73]|uniref:anthranilate synthase component I n=1 Tax=Allobranchiibius sp. GilTou73 TaxID=2904523 RepID=UPI001F1BB32B|nr:anthranilate synthase component I [Allobranchiibius sp. GilTou73]UIJ36583.1 anthranilate synthase component I [Allobranchiibius sp. GilTou73]
MTATDLHADLTFGRDWPSADLFAELARDRRVIPVVRRLLADAETPLGVYRKLAKDRPGTFLLESAEHGGVWSRYSIVGAASRATLSERNGQAHWIGEPPVGVPTDGAPTQALADTLDALRTPRIPGLPPLTGGMVGAVTYDAVRRFEKLPDTGRDDLGLPEISMMLASDLAVLDHSDGSILLVANAINYDRRPEGVERSYYDALARLERMQSELAAPARSTVSAPDPREDEPASTHSREQYHDMVEEAKEAIRSGEAFQIVVSQRFSVPCAADALDVYRALRVSNPSPYMYLLRIPLDDGSTYDIVGSSPEALVKVEGERVTTHPIAGSRPRGKTPEDDQRLASELAADPKERAEHLMLVDLSRNDLQRVCAPGSVETVEFMQTRYYSHIMHLESTVVGRLREGVSAYDVLVATFPAGTLSGAPKPRAMALIDRYEGVRRGVYGGVVGYLDFAGDLDLAIAIRTAVIKDGRAHVQAGAGIVADSVPESEYQETWSKARAALRAVATAQGMSDIS